MGTRVKGYNIILSWNGKKLGGTISNSLGIKPKIKESLIKDDLGKSQKENVGYDCDISISGLVILNTGGDSAIQIDVDDLMDMSISGVQIPFVYKRVGSTKTRTGVLIISDYKEDSDSENIATYTVSAQVQGELIPGVVSTDPMVKTVTLTGISGDAVITGPGNLVKPFAFIDTLTATAAAFVVWCAAAYLAKGIVVTSAGAVITFTGAAGGVAFNEPVITTVNSNLNGVVA